MGDLPRRVAEITGCHPAIVYMGKKEFWHITRSHPEMRREEFQLAPWLIRDGSYYVDGRRANQMTIYGQLEHDSKLYTLGLKSVDHGCEVWVQTMYRIDPKKAERRSRTMDQIYGPHLL